MGIRVEFSLGKKIDPLYLLNGSPSAQKCYLNDLRGGGGVSRMSRLRPLVPHAILHHLTQGVEEQAGTRLCFTVWAQAPPRLRRGGF